MSDTDLVAVVEVASAYLAQNHIPAAEIPVLIASVYATLAGLGEAPEFAMSSRTRAIPAVSIRKTVTYEYLISLEDGKRYVALRADRDQVESPDRVKLLVKTRTWSRWREPGRAATALGSTSPGSG